MTAPLGWYEDGGAAALGTPLGIVLGVVMLFAWSAAWGAPPEHTDPALSSWFKSLKQPGSEASCCDISDCRSIDYRVRAGHYEAFVPADYLAEKTGGAETVGKWVPVPGDKVLKNEPNPTGRGVLCYTPWQGVLCFVSAAET